jgi:hypothetical protein
MMRMKTLGAGVVWAALGASRMKRCSATVRALMKMTQ